MDRINRTSGTYFNEMIDTFVHKPLLRDCSPEASQCEMVYVPAVNIIEFEEYFEVQMVVSGLKKTDLTVGIHEGILTVSAKAQSEMDYVPNFRRREFNRGPFARSFVLPACVDATTAKAECQEGMLTLKLGKKDSDESEISIINIT